MASDKSIGASFLGNLDELFCKHPLATILVFDGLMLAVAVEAFKT